MTEPGTSASKAVDHTHVDDLEDYGGGHVQARHGYLPMWLLIVYAIMFLWGLYYSYQYWGGLGPGRIG